jgi:putative SOS response-associated peptidase YedK
MCGRYTVRRVDLLQRAYAATFTPLFEEFVERPHFNVAPSQHVPVVRLNKAGDRVLGALRWGLIPHWTRGKPKTQPINARSETVASSGMFRQAFERRRCLMPADGFYEWQGLRPPKTPYFFRSPDDRPFAFAAVWERWQADEQSEPVETCCLLTTTPNGVMRPVHDRMPVILRPEDYGRWLDRGTTGADVADLLRPLPDDALERWPVSTAVNSVKHDDPSLIEPGEPEAGGSGPNSA